MSKRIIITGATGIVGSVLSQLLSARGDEVVVFSRNCNHARNLLPGCSEFVAWDSNDLNGCAASIEDADAVIHLAGTSIFGALWDDDYKKKIFNSRVEGTRNLVDAFRGLSSKPKHLITASAIGYYGASRELLFTEDSPPGEGFLPEVSRNWEAEAAKAEELGVSVARVRVGIVLDKNRGALSLILPLFKNFTGGTIGSGEQWVSWIHNLDCARAFVHILDNKLTGAFNAVAPNPVTMKDFSDQLAARYDKPSFVQVPKFLLESALDEAAIPVTEGIHVHPLRLLESGFTFEFPKLEKALENIL